MFSFTLKLNAKKSIQQQTQDNTYNDKHFSETVNDQIFYTRLHSGVQSTNMDNVQELENCIVNQNTRISLMSGRQKQSQKFKKRSGVKREAI